MILSYKPQAASNKQQAPEASSNKLDMVPRSCYEIL